MKSSITILSFAVAAAGALRTNVLLRNSEKNERDAIDPKDFVYVDGLRLKDGKGLHYITV